MSEQIESPTIYATVMHGWADGEFCTWILWPGGTSSAPYYWDQPHTRVERKMKGAGR